MPRRPRILIEGGVYHVYNRFARGESVFADPEEAIAFVELLRDVKQRDGLTILDVRYPALAHDEASAGNVQPNVQSTLASKRPAVAEQISGAAGGGPAVFGSSDHLYPS